MAPDELPDPIAVAVSFAALLERLGIQDGWYRDESAAGTQIHADVPQIIANGALLACGRSI